jgi:hypothetical protein
MELPARGGMRERLKRVVLKTTVRETVPGVRIPLPPPFEICWSLDCARDFGARLRRRANASSSNPSPPLLYSNSSITISGFDPSRNGGPQVPAPLEVKTCIFPIRLRPYTNCR